MANHKSALKRVRQTVKRRTRSRHIIASMRTQIKRLRLAVAEERNDDAKALLAEAVRGLSRAADKGVIHRNQASRKIGRLTRAVNQLG